MNSEKFTDDSAWLQKVISVSISDKIKEEYYIYPAKNKGALKLSKRMVINSTSQ